MNRLFIRPVQSMRFLKNGAFDANNRLSSRAWGKYKLLDAYAASNEAEFFAVVTERFFESPAALKLHFPDLYEEYKDFYQIDTAELFS